MTVADVADVVERVFEAARNRPTPGCSKPPPGVLYFIVKYVVDRVRGTRGELVTIPVAPVHRLYPREYLRARCIAAWLGAEDCVMMHGEGKVVLRLSCVKERLGLV